MSLSCAACVEMGIYTSAPPMGVPKVQGPLPRRPWQSGIGTDADVRLDAGEGLPGSQDVLWRPSLGHTALSYCKVRPPPPLSPGSDAPISNTQNAKHDPWHTCLHSQIEPKCIATALPPTGGPSPRFGYATPPPPPSGPSGPT